MCYLNMKFFNYKVCYLNVKTKFYFLVFIDTIFSFYKVGLMQGVGLHGFILAKRSMQTVGCYTRGRVVKDELK